jgi:predicted transcriptional regulator
MTRTNQQEQILYNRNPHQTTKRLQYRDEIQIIYSILEVIAEKTTYNGKKDRKGAIRGDIMTRCYLCFSQIKEYLPVMLSEDLISCRMVKYGKTEMQPEYTITEKGIEFQKIAKELYQLIN